MALKKYCLGASSQYDMDMLDARTEAREKVYFQNPTDISAKHKSNLCASKLMSIGNQFVWKLCRCQIHALFPPSDWLNNRRNSGVTRNWKRHFHA